MLLTTKLLHPSSELETERWLSENSAASELYQTNETVSTYKLYKSAVQMYNNKDFIDNKLYSNIKDIFSRKNKISPQNVKNKELAFNFVVEIEKGKNKVSKSSESVSPLLDH